MKTNQIITRPMGQFSVYQRTSDGMFNGSALMQEWNELHPEHRKDMAHFFRKYSTKRVIKLYEEKHGVKPYEKIKGQNTKDGRTPDTVWMVEDFFSYFLLEFGDIMTLELLWAVGEKYNQDYNKMMDDFFNRFNENLDEDEQIFIRQPYDIDAKEHVKKILSDDYEIVTEYRIQNCFYDLCIPEKHLIIELDGGSHNDCKDKYKNRLANEAGFYVYRYYDICPEEDMKLIGFVSTFDSSPFAITL